MSIDIYVLTLLPIVSHTAKTVHADAISVFLLLIYFHSNTYIIVQLVDFHILRQFCYFYRDYTKLNSFRQNVTIYFSMYPFQT